MLAGSAPRSRTRWARRPARTVVLPVPGPAMMASGPSTAVTARNWAGVKPLSCSRAIQLASRFPRRPALELVEHDLAERARPRGPPPHQLLQQIAACRGLHRRVCLKKPLHLFKQAHTAVRRGCSHLKCSPHFSQRYFAVRVSLTSSPAGIRTCGSPPLMTQIGLDQPTRGPWGARCRRRTACRRLRPRRQ